ncbi:MAG: helix-turn-helix transcriptional regulator [bacterium]
MDELKLFLKRVGENIRSLRKTSGLNQERLAEIADISPTYLGEIERGKRNCSIDGIRKICKGLGIKMERFFQLIEGEEKKPLHSVEASVLSCSKEKERWKFLISISVKEDSLND